jgi:flagellar protein FlaG
MTIYEIQGSNPAKNPDRPAGTNIPISESGKQKDFKNVISVSETKSSKEYEESKKATEEKIHRVIELMNDYVSSMQRDIKIKVDNDTGNIVVKVISEENGKVIRQIPSEEMLALAANMEELSGAFFDQIV